MVLVSTLDRQIYDFSNKFEIFGIPLLILVKSLVQALGHHYYNTQLI
jgi:hypothetical protein